MANNENLIPIPGRLHSVATEGHVSGADEIYDDTQQKDQETINSELIAAVGTGGSVDSRIAAEKTRAEGAEEALDGRVDTLEDAVGTGGSVDSRISAAVATETTRAQAAEADRYTKSETYSKTELNNLITTPNQEYVSVIATAQTTAATDVLPATGAADTTYRIGNWDGTQYNDSVFSEYAWNGSAYIKLSTKSQVGEVYDISVNHADTKYADLAAALGTNGANIPQSLRKGGMSVKFVQSSDNKYVQCRLMSDTFSSRIQDWQNEAVPYAFSVTKNPSLNRQIKELYIEGELDNSKYYGVFSCWEMDESGPYYQFYLISADTQDLPGLNFIALYDSRTKPIGVVQLTSNLDGVNFYAILDLEFNNNPSVYRELINLDIAQNIDYSPGISAYLKHIETDNIPTAGSNNLVKSGGVYDKIEEVNSKILYKPSFSVVHIGAYYNQLYNVTLQSNHKYYVKHVSGLLSNFFSGDGDDLVVVGLIHNTWVEFTPKVTAQPRCALGTDVPSGELQSVIVADADGVITELDAISEKISLFDMKFDMKTIAQPNFSVVQTYSYYNQVYDITLQANHRYYVKNIKGRVSNFYVDEADQVMAVSNRWVEFIPLITGNPKSSLGTSDPGQNYMEVAIIDFDYALSHEILNIDKSEPIYLSPDGNDSNSGASELYPKKTIQTVIDNGYKNIILAPGEYKNQSVIIDGKSGISIKCCSSISEPNLFENRNRMAHAKIDNSLDVEFTSYSGNIYVSPLSVDSSHSFYKVFISQELPVVYSAPDYYGRIDTYNAILWEMTSNVSACRKVVPVLTYAECEATEGTFFYDGSNIYLHPFENTIQEKTYKRLSIDSERTNLFTIQNSSNIDIEGIDVIYAPYYNLYINTVSNSSVKNCIFGFTAYGSSVLVVYSNIDFYSCISSRAAADGYAIAGTGNVCFYNCDGIYNYDDGVSHHEYSTGIVDGGRWMHNLKGGVTPAYGSKVNVQNVICNNNSIGIYYVANQQHNTNAELLLQNCLSFDNTSVDIEVDNYNVISHGCAYKTKSVSGTLIEYGNTIITQ